jgi:hypothetical protein
MTFSSTTSDKLRQQYLTYKMDGNVLLLPPLKRSNEIQIEQNKARLIESAI